MVFKPLKFPGLAYGLAAALLLVGAEAGALAILRTAPLSFLAFLALCFLVASLPVLGFVSYRCYGLARARYVLSRNALVVEWGGRRELVPLASIREVRAVTEAAELASLRPRGFAWPGCMVGKANFPALGLVEFLASANPRGLVLVAYDGRALALSPADPQAFAQTFADLRAEGPSAQIEAESLVPNFQQWGLWRDRLALALIAAGGLGGLGLMGYMLLVYPGLPAEVVLHFNALGQPDRWGAPINLLILPIIAGGTWLVNTLFGLTLWRQARERPMAYLLFAATVFTQALVWTAALGLVAAAQ